MSSGLYIASLIVRCVILFVILRKYGLTAFGLAWVYALISVVSDASEVIV